MILKVTHHKRFILQILMKQKKSKEEGNVNGVTQNINTVQENKNKIGD